MKISRMSPLVLSTLTAHLAFAGENSDAPSFPGEEQEVNVVPADDKSTSEENKTLEERMEDLEDQMQRAETERRQARDSELESQSPITFNGYVDFGFFVPSGDGSGLIEDYGHERVPDLKGKYGWVFLGDILSTPVNTRGEAADLGQLPGTERFDSVDSHGAPGFLLNEANIGVNVGFSDSARLVTSLNFVPRSGSDFSIGDFFELDVAQLEWTLSRTIPTAVFIGKIEPVVGIEYKHRKSNTRFGITPSLLARYTSGTSLGLKVRSKLFDDWLVVAAAVTNGSSVTEQFHFYRETDTNLGKTASARAALHVPLERLMPGMFNGALEIGFSGEAGPQDGAFDNAGYLWFAGVDVEYNGTQFSLHGQALRGAAPGKASDGVFSLDLKNSAYLEASYMFTEMFGLLLRGDFRDALVTLGSERAYLTKTWRATIGGRVAISQHAVVKAEFMKNFEYAEVPEFANDVFTTSAVFIY